MSALDRLAEIKHRGWRIGVYEAVTGQVCVPPSMVDDMNWLIAEVERLRAALDGLNKSVNDLISDSGGVYGLHLNGDEAPWDSLTTGGRFEDWLGPALDQAAAALDHQP